MCEIAFDFFREVLPEAKWGDTDLVIERQMKSGIMRLFAVSLEVAWFHVTGSRAHVISPILVKRHFGTSTGAYGTNKRAALDLMVHLCEKHETIHEAWIETCKNCDKIDDVADSIIQALYFIQR